MYTSVALIPPILPWRGYALLPSLSHNNNKYVASVAIEGDGQQIWPVYVRGTWTYDLEKNFKMSCIENCIINKRLQLINSISYHKLPQSVA
jgi:hypothetical protein